jgi:cell division protein FtsQ
MLRQTKTRQTRLKSRGSKSRLALFTARFQRIGLRFFALMIVLCGCTWFVLSGGITKTQNMAEGAFIEVSAKAGFRLQNIFVEGREYADPDLLMALINAEKNMPLFKVKPHQIHDALSGISWIETVSVKRVFPDSLNITLKERQPAALWMNEGRLVVVDNAGYRITTQNLERFEDLLIIQGEDAPENIGAFLDVVRAVPKIYERLDQAVFVGNRRWDLKLNNKIIVNLPEDNIALALQRLVRAHERDEVLDKTIKNIDIRQSDRLIIKAYPGAANKSYDYISGAGAPI